MSEPKTRSDCGDETELANGSEWYWFNICKRIKREQEEDGRVRLWYGQYFVPERTCENISNPPDGFYCSSCHWGDFAEPTHLLTASKYTGRESGGPNYCPNCGAKVV